MPWRKTEPMEERLKLIADRLAGYSITELSVIYGVSRKTVTNGPSVTVSSALMA